MKQLDYAPVKVPLGPDKTRVQETQRYVLSRQAFSTTIAQSQSVNTFFVGHVY